MVLPAVLVPELLQRRPLVVVDDSVVAARPCTEHVVDVADDSDGRLQGAVGLLADIHMGLQEAGRSQSVVALLQEVVGKDTDSLEEGLLVVVPVVLMASELHLSMELLERLVVLES